MQWVGYVLDYSRHLPNYVLFFNRTLIHNRGLFDLRWSQTETAVISNHHSNLSPNDFY